MNENSSDTSMIKRLAALERQGEALMGHLKETKPAFVEAHKKHSTPQLQTKAFKPVCAKIQL